MFKKVISLCLVFIMFCTGLCLEVGNFSPSQHGNSIISVQVKKAEAKRSGPVGKANRKKQGREVNEKKKQGNWQSNPNKSSDRPMKKHTPSKKHKGGK
ncbi:hypothetical protein [Paenibacillus thiaminolyticus]|uniref:hypothetical protein n=1 Tax=Paenibacillus thiaminolyticus TaxID=49283 RepID=UPI001C7218CD|nr:hypothetical protein [Paenibacillus thiaminolyticus]